MTASLDPLIDLALEELVLIPEDDRTREGCISVAESVAQGHPELTVRQLATVLERDFVIPMSFGGWRMQLLDPTESVTTVKPEFGFRVDGQPVLYPGLVHWLYGEAESGKTWIALQFVAECLAAGESVAYIDLEMSKNAVVGRLQAIGAQLPMYYCNPQSSFPEESWPDIAADLKLKRVKLVVVDAATELMALHGWDPSSNADTAVFGRFIGVLASSGAAIIVIDHLPKNRDTRGKGPIGAQHKRAFTSVSLEVKVLAQPDRSRSGKLSVRVDKDREGWLLEAANDARVLMIVELVPDDGMLLVTFREPPEGHATTDGGDFRPTHYMARVSEYVHSQDDGPRKPPSRNQIEKGVSGKQEYIRQAIDALANEGFIEEIADGNARRYRFIDRYTEYDNE